MTPRPGPRVPCATPGCKNLMLKNSISCRECSLRAMKRSTFLAAQKDCWKKRREGTPYPGAAK